MNFFNFNIKKILLVLFILALPLLSINMQHESDESSWFSRPFGFIGSLVQNAYFNFSQGVRGSTKLYLDLINIKKENLNLKNQNAEMKAQLTAMTELKLENQRFSELLNFKQKTKMNLMAAKVMSRDLVTDHATIQINRGSRDGLKAGQAVITVSGAVGYIFKPDLFTSQVLLITDRYAVVDGIVQRSRARGIIEGKSQSTCVLRYVERVEDVQVGDLIVTSGIDNIFPKGFPVATVEYVEKKPLSVSLRVDLKPVVDPRKIEEVFVILDAAQEDLSTSVSMNTTAVPNLPAVDAAKVNATSVSHQ